MRNSCGRRMVTSRGRRVRISCLLLAVLLFTNSEAAPIGERDYSSMWWADGFPSVIEGASWNRVIQTGHYGFVLNTESLKVPHFGKIQESVPYADCGKGSRWKALPAADLALAIKVNGKSYRCVAGGEWSRHGGPRLIESGRFLQRADVTGLKFESADGEVLSTEARLETAAWPDRMGLMFEALPGKQAIQAGEASFGKVGGGFGLDGTNALEVPHSDEIDPEKFTLELWAFVPADYRASKRAWPWLVCKNRNEARDGNFGMMVLNGKLKVRMNIGGGRDGVVECGDRIVKIGAWNHLVMSYDGKSLRAFVNGRAAGESTVNRKRKPGRDALVFGRRGDNGGDGYHFRGVIDGVRLFDRALTPAELRKADDPVRRWEFKKDGVSSEVQPEVAWEKPELKIRFEGLESRAPGKQVWLAVDPLAMDWAAKEKITVKVPGRPVVFEPAMGWHRINLDKVKPIRAGTNDAIELIPLTISNPTDQGQVARLMFEKTSGGIAQKLGSPITGMSAILRDASGEPSGIPVQFSKNWHNAGEAGAYAGTVVSRFDHCKIETGRDT